MPPSVRDGRTNQRILPAYVASQPSAAPKPRPHVLKHGDCFAVLDAFGDAQATELAAEGLFFEDTRYLSQLALAIDGTRPRLLASSVSDDNAVLIVDLAGSPHVERGCARAERDAVHILKHVWVGENALFLRLALRNFGVAAISLRVAFHFDADFVDIFELRGTARRKTGQLLENELIEDGSVLAYIGLDRVVRRTRLTFVPSVDKIDARQAQWHIDLPAQGERTVELTAQCERSDRPINRPSRERSLADAERRKSERAARVANIHSSCWAFNDVIARLHADLEMLVTQTPQGPYAYAGLPWFSTPFGRDGLITALQCLWLDPELAAGTLRYLASCQAASVDEGADAEPGKILHETRKGEMAELGEIPFRRYYGSIDATPLFIMLAAAYHARTGDIDLVRELWPNIEAALVWMSDYGDADGDGFLEYDRRSANGLVNQGWKDSADAIFHADGTNAEPPVALAEVQAYAYAAYDGAAVLARALGNTRRAIELCAAADRLKQKFETEFWLEELGTYALALDGAKRPCRVLTSNAGQALFGGIASARHAGRVADTLMTPQLFSRWGIRTVAEGEVRYNPMSYHNGSIWPHDNGLIAMGFARYGRKQLAVELLTGFVEAAHFMEMRRLPEFFCGFARRPGIGPTPHPAACAPQAWASASIIAMLGALLGISFDPARRQVHLAGPVLPPWIDMLELSNLRLGSAAIDFQLHRRGDEVTLHVARCDGEMDVVVTT